MVAIEIGPGPGGLTRSLLQTSVGKVIAIEKDKRFSALLQPLEEASDGRLKVFFEDALEMRSDELQTEFPASFDELHIIGNLPFNIATPLLMAFTRDTFYRRGLFGFPNVKSELTLMFQKEVAQGICAAPRAAYRSRLSVISQAVYDTKIIYEVKNKSFVPRPQVHAAVVQFRPKPTPYQFTIGQLEKLTAHGFTHTARKLVSNMSSLMVTLYPKHTKEQREAILKRAMDEAKICSQIRARSLTTEQWCILSNHLFNQ